MQIKSIQESVACGALHLEGKTVLVRADLNVPIKDGKVSDDTRIQAVFPTINLLINNGAKIVLMGHLETKDGTGMSAVFDFIKTLNLFNIDFASGKLDAESAPIVKGKIDDMQSGGVLLLDNLRLNEGEKNNDADYSALIAGLGDIYVNDAFSVCHREHASIVGVSKLMDHYAGLQLMKEVQALDSALKPSHPLVFIIGGAKFETKMPIIEKYMGLADSVVVGGALMNDLYKAKGLNVGASLISSVVSGAGLNNFDAIVASPKLVLSPDVRVVSDLNDKNAEIKMVEDVQNGEIIVDVGPSLINRISDLLISAKYVIWNGPLGNYEIGFGEETNNLARKIFESKVPGVIGGGDTLAAIKNIGVDLADNPQIFVSTAGGAMIDYLSKETLPGLDALKV